MKYALAIDITTNEELDIDPKLLGKRVYLFTTISGPELTLDVMGATMKNSIEDLLSYSSIKFKDKLLDTGHIVRGDFLYTCFGTSEEIGTLVIVGIDVNDVQTITEDEYRIKLGTDEEYSEYLRLKEKFTN